MLHIGMNHQLRAECRLTYKPRNFSHVWHVHSDSELVGPFTWTYIIHTIMTVII